jgi:uncharacterized protein (TIGR03437 family)
MPESGRQTLAATVVKLPQKIQQIKEREETVGEQNTNSGMLVRIIFCGILLALSQPALRAQGTPTVIVGWYNGDCHTGSPGGSNWYVSNQQFGRVYDEFLVPSGGWTVAGVFSNNTLYNAPPITQASWEIRSGLSAGNGGTVIASGVSPATQTYNSALRAYRIEVDGLQVQLAPGDFFISVTPVGTANTQSYVCQTQGQNAIGSPAGNGMAFYSSQSGSFLKLTAADGTNLDYSQGVRISLQASSPSDQWRADVTVLAQQMPALYSLPFPGISLDDFNAKAADLYNRIPALSGAEIRTGMEELVAAIEDPHTDVVWPSPSLFRLLPLSFYWFDDGIYVTGAATQYQSLLGGRLVFVGQTGIDDATRILAALVPHENNQWLKYVIPIRELTNADYLFGKGLIGGIESAPLKVQTASSGTSSVVSADLQSYANSQGPGLTPVFQGDPPLYRQHLDRYYWATVIDQGATVYFQYNSCQEDPKQPSADFFKQLDQMMAQSGVERVILDMRINTGGTTSILSPWIDQIRASRFNQPGRLYVIVGRATFSAAMEHTNHLHDRTAAIFVGEPTGAKPRFQLRRGDFALPYFGIRVSYSNGVEAANEPGPTLIPDICTGLTFQDYMNGVDRALNAILSIPASRLASAVFRPSINAGGLVNAASYTAPLTPGGVASLFGSNLADSTVLAGLPLPTVLGGVTVTVNGVAAPLYFVSPNQINFQVPWELLGQAQASVTVTAGGGIRLVANPDGSSNYGLASLSQAAKVAVSPALFSIDSRGTGQGAILIANSDIVAAPEGSIPGRNTRPARRGEFISIFCTGLGDVANRPASGAPPSPAALASTTLTPSVTIGGAPAPVAFSGLAPGFVGLYQVNVQVPGNAPSGGAVPVVVTLGGASSNTVTIAAQ